jgi:hypothetical protein
VKNPKWFIIAACCAVGCTPEPEYKETSGVNIPAGPCGRGLRVVNSDYQITSVSLMNFEGVVLSPNLISTSSTTTGPWIPITGDVVTSSAIAPSEDIILIDRSSSTLTWVDVSSGQIARQLGIGTGFAPNPQDYVEVAPTKAYVTRFEQNSKAGSVSFDGGNDVLIINPTTPAIVGRIDLMPAMQGAGPEFLPRASRVQLLGKRLYILLQSLTSAFVSTSSRIAVIDTTTDTIVQTLVLDGLHSCGAMDMSPDEAELAIACSGSFGGDSNATLSESGLVLISVGDSNKEKQRFDAGMFNEGPIGFSVSYTSDRNVIFTTFGRFANGVDPGRDDTVIELNLDSGASSVLLRSEGDPFTLGDTHCSPVCNVCFVTDAGRGGGLVHRFEVDALGHLDKRTEIHVDTVIGLPPRQLGVF